MSKPDHPLLTRLRERQCLLLLTFTQGKWTSLLKVGEGWVLDRSGPQLWIIQQAYKSGQPCIILDAEKDPRLTEFGSTQDGFRSCLCLPLQSEAGHFLGVLLLEDRDRIQAFPPSDIEDWMRAVEPMRKEMSNSAYLPEADKSVSSFPLKARLLGVAVLALLAGGLTSMRPPKPPPPRPPSRLPSRSQASSKMVAQSLVASLVRADFAAALALSTLDGRVGTARFRSQAEKWMGDPRQARSLAFREVQEVAEKDNRCQFSLVGIGEAEGFAAIPITLIRTDKGWRWQPPWGSSSDR